MKLKSASRYVVFFLASLFVLAGLSMIFDLKSVSLSTAHSQTEEVVAVPDEAATAKRKAHRTCEGNKNCYTENFTQPNQNISAVDLLFVVDSSETMRQELNRVVKGAESFIRSLPKRADFNIAVILAHGSTSPYTGKLFQARNEPVVLKSTELSTPQILAGLHAKMKGLVPDPGSDGGEEGIFSLFAGVTRPELRAVSIAQGFFRPQAALAVVFVSDENDICAQYPAGVTPVPDPDNLEAPARLRDCEGITPAGLTNQLTLLKAGRPINVSAIIYADSPVRPGPENELGFGYLEMAELNNGLAIDLANDDIDEGLASIAELAGEQMGPQSGFLLAHSGAIAATVRVKVNGMDVPFTLIGDRVTVTQPIPAGAVVVITYCGSADQIEGCDCKHPHWRQFHRGKGYGHGPKHCKKK